MLQGSDRPLLLRGKIVQPDGTAPDRYVLVRDGRIVSVSRQRPPLTEGVPYVKTESEDWIFPGLLDLHTHTTYNALPLWHSWRAPFDNRFEWRGDDGYKKEVSGTSRAISTPENRKILEVFAELQAVTGGTTVLQESQPLDKEIAGQELLLCRDTADPADLFLNEKGVILSVVDFFRPKDGQPEAVGKALDEYVKRRQEGTLLATLAHLAEGRSGYGTLRGVDPYSRLEFETFMAHPAFADPAAVRSSPLTLIHGCGIDTRNPRHLDFLRERNISIVWSPVSNLLLYGDTLDAETLLAEGINVALGSDWSPSGSKHVWEEAKFARFYFDAIGARVSNQQIFQMVTRNAARCLGLPFFGCIEPGAPGDFFILRSPLETDDPMEVFLATTDRHVRATILGGLPLYGAREFLEQFEVALQGLPPEEGSAVKDKAVHLPAALDVDVARDVKRIEDAMKALTPPVKRSNLLASSDKLFRRRLQQLRSQAVTLGWSIQESRRRGDAPVSGRLAVRPDAIQVWRGVRAAGLDAPELRRALGEVLLPAAVQTQAPLGLAACLTAVLPDDRPAHVPDEVALLVYESREAWDRTSETTAGRIWPRLRGALFGPESQSGFAQKLDAALEPDRPYFLFADEADWLPGLTKVLVATAPEGQTGEAFRAAVQEALAVLQGDRPPGLDGAIAMVSADGVLVYWEHWIDAASAANSRIAGLAALGTPVLLADAVPTKVAAHPAEFYPGLEIKGGECLSLRFERRRLYLY